MKSIRLWFLVFFVFANAPAYAAPPAECVGKFVGSWTVRVNATGQTYPAQIFANGRSQVSCPMCTPGGSWTCSGNTYSFTVDNGASGSATLSADGRTMSGGCCTTTRNGAPPSSSVAASKDAKAKSAALAPQPTKPAKQQKAGGSCGSDITGTDNTAPAPNASDDCKAAVRSLHAARVLKGKKQFSLLAPEEYKKAAAAAQRAGDTELMLKIIREAEQLDQPTAPAEPEAAAADPASDETCAAPARAAAKEIGNAQFMEKTIPTCSGLLQAADNYYAAAQIYFRTIKMGTQVADVVKSCALKKTDEYLRRRDALKDRVSRMKAAGECDAKRIVSKKPPPDDGENKATECKAKLKILTGHGDDAWVKDQMARGDVPCNADGTPM